MQHWVFCEILCAAEKHAATIDFVDAHSMAPIARERHAPDLTSWMFDAVRDHLPGQLSAYERMWAAIVGTPAICYPNSAAFLVSTWEKPWNLILCETNEKTVEDLRKWKRQEEANPSCRGIEVWANDWRRRFDSTLRLDDHLVFFSFDPYKYTRHQGNVGNGLGDLHRQDLDSIARAIQRSVNDKRGSVLIQISTYRNGPGNEQDVVKEEISRSLEAAGLEVLGDVRASGVMMSLVLGRNLEWGEDIQGRLVKFDRWLKQAKVEAILDLLSEKRIRATYGSVAGVLEIQAVEVAQFLGERRPRASWVVSQATGMPTGYTDQQLDPALNTATEIIHLSEALLTRLRAIHDDLP